MKKMSVLGFCTLVSGCSLIQKMESREATALQSQLEDEIFQETAPPTFEFATNPEAAKFQDEFKTENLGGDRHRMLFQQGDAWIPLLELPVEDLPTTQPLAWSKDRQSLFLKDARGRHTAALVRLEMKTLQPSVLTENSRADLREVFFRMNPERPAAVSYEYDKKSWVFLDRRVESQFKKIQELFNREISVVGQNAKDSEWLIRLESENEAPAYCVFDTERQKCLRESATPISEAQKSIRTESTVLRGSDGLRLLTFVTQKLEPASPRPLLIVIDHGAGQRFQKNFNAFHRYFAEVGFAVVSVNYRGSRGLGKTISQEGKIQSPTELALDFKDVLDWVAREKIADNKKVALLAWGDGSVTGEKIYPRLKKLLTCGSRIEKDKKKRSETLLEVSLLLNRCP